MVMNNCGRGRRMKTKVVEVDEDKGGHRRGQRLSQMRTKVVAVEDEGGRGR